MAAFDATDSGDLTIEELTGDKRTVRFRDRALPSRQGGMPFEREQSLNTGWYQGSPVGTQQPQGSELKPTTISGTWKDRYIDADPPHVLVSQPGATSSSVTTALDVANLMDDICAKGQTVRVTFLSIVRIGGLARFKFNPRESEHDVEWEMEFEWQAAGTSAGRVSSVVNRDHGARAREVSGAAATVSDSADWSATQVPLDQGFVADFGTQVQAVSDSAADAEDQAFGLADGFLDPAASAIATAGALGVVVDNAESCMETIWARTSRTWMRVNQLSDQATLAGGQVLAVTAALWDTLYACRETQRKAARNAYDLSTQTNGQPAQIVRARQGDDLRSIAQRNGMRDEDWPALADYNDLSTSALVPGQKVAIPPGRQVRK